MGGAKGGGPYGKPPDLALPVDGAADAVPFETFRQERSMMDDQRRCNSWYLVDASGNEYLAVVGEERETRDGHYTYKAEEPFYSIQPLICGNQTQVFNWLEAMKKNVKIHNGELIGNVSGFTTPTGADAATRRTRGVSLSDFIREKDTKKSKPPLSGTKHRLGGAAEASHLKKMKRLQQEAQEQAAAAQSALYKRLSGAAVVEAARREAARSRLLQWLRDTLTDHEENLVTQWHETLKKLWKPGSEESGVPRLGQPWGFGGVYATAQQQQQQQQQQLQQLQHLPQQQQQQQGHHGTGVHAVGLHHGGMGVGARVEEGERDRAAGERGHGAGVRGDGEKVVEKQTGRNGEGASEVREPEGIALPGDGRKERGEQDSRGERAGDGRGLVVNGGLGGGKDVEMTEAVGSVKGGQGDGRHQQAQSAEGVDTAQPMQVDEQVPISATPETPHPYGNGTHHATQQNGHTGHMTPTAANGLSTSNKVVKAGQGGEQAGDDDDSSGHAHVILHTATKLVDYSDDEDDEDGNGEAPSFPRRFTRPRSSPTATRARRGANSGQLTGTPSSHPPSKPPAKPSVHASIHPNNPLMPSHTSSLLGYAPAGRISLTPPPPPPTSQLNKLAFSYPGGLQPSLTPPSLSHAAKPPHAPSSGAHTSPPPTSSPTPHQTHTVSRAVGPTPTHISTNSNNTPDVHARSPPTSVSPTNPRASPAGPNNSPPTHPSSAGSQGGRRLHADSAPEPESTHRPPPTDSNEKSGAQHQLDQHHAHSTTPLLATSPQHDPQHTQHDTLQQLKEQRQHTEPTTPLQSTSHPAESNQLNAQPSNIKTDQSQAQPSSATEQQQQQQQQQQQHHVQQATTEPSVQQGVSTPVNSKLRQFGLQQTLLHGLEKSKHHHIQQATGASPQALPVGSNQAKLTGSEQAQLVGREPAQLVGSEQAQLVGSKQAQLVGREPAGAVGSGQQGGMMGVDAATAAAAVHKGRSEAASAPPQDGIREIIECLRELKGMYLPLRYMHKSGVVQTVLSYQQHPHQVVCWLAKQVVAQWTWMVSTRIQLLASKELMEDPMTVIQAAFGTSETPAHAGPPAMPTDTDPCSSERTPRPPVALAPPTTTNSDSGGRGMRRGTRRKGGAKSNLSKSYASKSNISKSSQGGGRQLSYNAPEGTGQSGSMCSDAEDEVQGTATKVKDEIKQEPEEPSPQPTAPSTTTPDVTPIVIPAPPQHSTPGPPQPSIPHSDPPPPLHHQPSPEPQAPTPQAPTPQSPTPAHVPTTTTAPANTSTNLQMSTNAHTHAPARAPIPPAPSPPLDPHVAFTPAAPPVVTTPPPLGVSELAVQDAVNPLEAPAEERPVAEDKAPVAEETPMEVDEPAEQPAVAAAAPESEKAADGEGNGGGDGERAEQAKEEVQEVAKKEPKKEAKKEVGKEVEKEVEKKVEKEEEREEEKEAEEQAEEQVGEQVGEQVEEQAEAEEEGQEDGEDEGEEDEEEEDEDDEDEGVGKADKRASVGGKKKPPGIAGKTRPADKRLPGVDMDVDEEEDEDEDESDGGSDSERPMARKSLDGKTLPRGQAGEKCIPGRWQAEGDDDEEEEDEEEE